MKKFIFSAMLMMAAWMGANAMSFERARAEALYLTDKMAYELNLNDKQYDYVYEINFDYFFRIDSPSDLKGNYYNHRLNDLRCILLDWQYSILVEADYLLHPIAWRSGSWFFPVYDYYKSSHFYYDRPPVWHSYLGGHSRFYHQNGFYAHLRPMWNGGLRGHDMHRPSPQLSRQPAPGPSPRPNPGMGGRPNPGTPGGGMRGNSFDGSSSRMGGGPMNGPGSRMGSGPTNGPGSRMSGNGPMGGSRGNSGNFGGGSRGNSGSFGGGSRGNSGSFGGGSRSNSGSFGGGSRGGSMGASRGSGPSRGGRR